MTARRVRWQRRRTVASRVAPLDERASQQLEALAREHQRALLAMGTRLTGDPVEARELVQDTFERASTRLHHFEPGTNARAWLISILYHLFIDRCRRKKREPRMEPFEESTLPPIIDRAPPPPWSAITPEQLRGAIGQLSEDFRKVYEAHALQGRSYEDIAQSLNLPKATVGTRLLRARRKLKALLLGHANPRGEEEGEP